METNKETAVTIQSRLDILRKGLISEENSVNYYQTLIEKTTEDSEVNIGMRRMYYELMLEEKKHVEYFKILILSWETKLNTMNNL
jgi:rubrerythrin